LLLAAAHAVSQAVQGVPWVAAIVMVAMLAAGAAAGRWLWPRTAQAPRRLKLATDGGMTLQLCDGSSRRVHLQPGSIRLGGWLVLHLQATDGCSFRLVLGPDNLDGRSLAALRRRLRRPPTATGALL